MDNVALAKFVSMQIKKAYKGTTHRTGYVGTGSKAHRRQVFVRLPNGNAIDLWFEAGRVELGGVIRNPGVCRRSVDHGTLSEQQIADAVVEALKVLAVEGSK